jgi:hypothetical protein
MGSIQALAATGWKVQFRGVHVAVQLDLGQEDKEY